MDDPGRAAPDADAEAERARREAMVERQLRLRGVRDERVLAAMGSVPRHLFVPPDRVDEAYEDVPLPIGGGKTISQPYIVAAMTERARVRPASRVLEVGTGSGYQTAVLAALGAAVWSIEIDPALAARAREALERAGVIGVTLREGDGWGGWPEAAPFDAVVVTAAPSEVPAPLMDQLAIGGHLVIPVGQRHQELLVITRLSQRAFTQEHVFPVAFVPMTGRALETRGRPSRRGPLH